MTTDWSPGQELWKPSPERTKAAALTRFMHFVQERYKAPIHDYASLHRWSVEFPENFWGAVWDFCEVRASQQASQIVADAAKLPGAQWFVGALFNYAENLLRLDDDSIALLFRNESGQRRELSWRELRCEVARIADGLKTSGVKTGDRVCGYLPHLPEAVIAMLATTSLGAIWSSCSPDLGAAAATDRLGQIQPRVLFATDGSASIIDTVRQQLPSIEQLVLIPYLRDDLEAPANTVLFKDFGSPKARLSFTQLPFEHPAFITCSETAGVTNCIVHSAGGALLQQLKQHILHSDVGREDRYLHDTTGASALATGATLVLFDGSTDLKAPWRVVQEERITIFATHPDFLIACEQAGLRPREEFDLSALRTLIATGRPLNPSSFHYVYRDVHPDVQLSSISSDPYLGTGCPLLPVYEGEIQALGLGMKVEIYDDEGRPVIGQPGALVCSQAFPSVPLGFWGDAENQRFVDSYFSRYPNVWWQGDRATLTSRGGLIVHD